MTVVMAITVVRREAEAPRVGGQRCPRLVTVSPAEVRTKLLEQNAEHVPGSGEEVCVSGAWAIETMDGQTSHRSLAAHAVTVAGWVGRGSVRGGGVSLSLRTTWTGRAA